jgi:rhodanese-related sulfurtransferase
MIRSAAILLSLTLVAAALTHWLHPRAPAWYLAREKAAQGEVNLQDIQDRWQGQVLWIDARVRSRYEQEHIPGALSLNEQEFDQQLFDLIETLQSNTKPIVIYCDAQKCQASKQVRDALQQRVGLSDLWILHGGWPVWKAAQQ